METEQFIEMHMRTTSSVVTIKVIASKKELIPLYNSAGAAGADIRANIQEKVTIAPGKSAVIPTGLFFEIPPGFEVQIRSRSGLAAKNQVMVLNSPGTIDSDYRGEVAVILMNFGNAPFIVLPDMRIAQMVVAQVIQAQFVTVDELEKTERGAGGFGHTGTH